MPDIVYILEVVVAFALVIFIHELGHFLAAKWCGVHVRKFAIGFGPPMVKWQPGETEYSLRPVPLGGYVDLAGEHPDVDKEDDPRALWRRPAWQRVIVFSAGVGMNAVLAVVLFAVASLVGVKTVAPVVGQVVPFKPAAGAGLQAGDRIVRINGRPVDSFLDIQSIIVGRDAGAAFDLVVERREASGESRRLTFEDVRSVREEGDAQPVLGVAPALEPVLARVAPGSPAAQAGLQARDRILAVGARPVSRWGEVAARLEEAGDGPVTLTLRRNDAEREITARLSALKQVEIGMAPPVAVAAVDPAGPAAEAGLRAGDLLRRVDGTAWPAIEMVRNTIRATPEGAEVQITVERDAEAKRVTVTPRIYGEFETPHVGIVMGLANALVRVGHVAPDGPAAKARLRPGDRIVRLRVEGEESEPDTWQDVEAAFLRAKTRPVTVHYRRGEAAGSGKVAGRLQPLERFALQGAAPGYTLYEPLPRIYNPVAAAGQGFRRTWTWLKRVYTNVLQLAKLEVGTESLGGPVLIATASYTIASRGLGTLLDFWGILSVCIAVINFLPMPPFDGGHVVFVLIEKIKGAPVSMKVRGAIWGAGWAAVLALFLWITWQDIGRLLAW